MKRLFIIDGSGFLYRAYYGLPEMIDKDGHNANVVYGFTKMILSILFDQPDYFIIARDMPKKTIRHQKFKDYKGTRPKIEDDLKSQIPKTQELIKQMGIPSLGVEGYEADDIIATYANTGSQKGLQTTIYSSDKDLKQMLSENIIVKDPMRYYQVSNVKSFTKEYGFLPTQMLYYLSLLGDSSDNIPGILGIGKKTATKLIIEYGNLDNIYANIDNFKGKLKEKLLTGKESAYYSMDLIELMEVPNTPGLDSCEYKINTGNWQKLLVEEWGFNSLSKTLDTLDKKCNQPKEISLF